MKKVLVFGTGQYYENYKENIKSLGNEIIGFLDNNTEKVGTFIDGVLVSNPKDVIKMEYDKIIIMSMFVSEITEQLLEYGISRDKILIYDIYEERLQSGIREYWPKKLRVNEGGRSIVLLSHELSYTGAPIALKYVAEVMLENGDNPIIVSPFSGPLLNDFLDIGIPVIIETCYSDKCKEFSNIVKGADLIFINTIIFHKIVSKLFIFNIPMIWWIHEGKNTFKKINRDFVSHILNNINIYCVGNYIKKVWECLDENLKINTFFYGIPDNYDNNVKIKCNDKVIFSIVGTIDYRKAQDIFVKAIINMPSEYREKCKFRIIGKINDKEFYQELKEMALGIEEIEFYQEMNNEELKKYYLESDVVVSTSRDDPMPIVLTEAMMFNKPCICSTSTGTAFLIEDGKDGFTFQSEDYNELISKMIYVIDNRDKVRDMGKKARKIYEENFEFNAFSKKLLNIISESMN